MAMIQGISQDVLPYPFGTNAAGTLVFKKRYDIAIVQHLSKSET